MQSLHRILCLCFLALAVGGTLRADWRQFRRPGGLGISDEKGLPVEWSAEKNIVWKVKLPGANASCPVTNGKHARATGASSYR